MPTLTLEEIAGLAGVELAAGAAGGLQVSRVAALQDAGPEALVFAQDEASLAAAMASGAGIILAAKKLVQGGPAAQDARVLAVAAPKYVFALAARRLSGESARGIHPTASVDATARIGLRASIGALAVVEAGAVLGDDVTLAAGAKVLQGVEMGSRVVVQAGAVLGGTGFGYASHPVTGEHILFPQQGRLVIEDDVEIGANTTIDRGALGETRIGAGTKIDNLVQIGHNCRIGRRVLIASQVGISGSCVIGDGAVLAGQVGLGDHVTIGPGVILGGQGGVYPGKTVTGPGEMFAGTPAEPVREFLKSLARVRRMK